MYDIKTTYRTKLGNLTCTFTDTATVATREEAYELRAMLKAYQPLRDAIVQIVHAKPLATPDEAFENLIKRLREYPPLREEA